MKARWQVCNLARPVWISALLIEVGLYSCVTARSDRIDDLFVRQATIRQRVSRNVKANRLVRERLEFLQRLAPKVENPLGSSTFSAYYALFPEGKSARIYIVAWNMEWPESAESVGTSDDSWFLCYQRQGGKDKQVYRLRVSTGGATAKDQARVKASGIRSVRDYLISKGADVTGAASRYARADLNLKRDYTVYEYIWPIETLEVSSFPRERVGGCKEVYYMDTQRTPDQKSTWQDFFPNYGLPLSHRELVWLGINVPCPTDPCGCK